MSEVKGKKQEKVGDLIPGLLLALVIALPSIWIHERIYKPISALALAIILGLLIRNVLGVPKAFNAGIGFSIKRILKIGIILLGVRLSFMDVVKTGINAVGIIATCIIISVLLVQYISKRLGLPEKLGTLIGVGTAICGVSAIVATSPTIEAKEEETAFAVATITLFGLLAVFVYPLMGGIIGLSQITFGTWAGTAINDTSQVVAGAFIYGSQAGEVATVVKLTRNLFIAPAVLVTGYIYALKRAKREATEKKKVNLVKIFPWFVLGFIGMAILRTINVFPASLLNILKPAADYLIAIAIASVGLSTSFNSMRDIGLKPFFAGLTAAIIMAVISLTFITLVGIK